MTAPGRYAASDGSFAKSTGSAAARGGILIAIAVVIGLLLLWKGFDGGDSDPAAVGGGDVTTTTDPNAAPEETVPPGDDTTTTLDPGEVDPNGETTTPPTGDVAVDPPSSVNVAVLNGSGIAGQAGLRTDHLGSLGYVSQAGNAVESTEASKVYYKPEFAEEAKAVADALAGAEGGAAALEPITQADSAALGLGEDDQAKASDADVVVVLGTDGALA